VSLTQTLQDWILLLPNVTKALPRFGGTEFQVHGLEFMHTHGALQLDIKLSKQDQERMLKEGKAEPHSFVTSPSRLGHFQKPIKKRH